MIRKIHHPPLGLIVAVALAGLLWLPTVSASVLDPQIYIQQSGSAPAGGDPNLLLNPGAFTIGVAGNFTLLNPLLVIVGVYNGSGTPSISFSGCTSACPSATVGTYGLTSATGTLTALSTGTAFAQLGLAAGGSESFTNWSGADVANGLAAPGSFSLYAFAVNTSLDSSTPITVGESGASIGSFILAYGCTSVGTDSSGCASEGDVGQTVFTDTGLVDGPSVPEPGALALLAAGLGVLGIALSRKRRHPSAR